MPKGKHLARALPPQAPPPRGLLVAGPIPGTEPMPCCFTRPLRPIQALPTAATHLKASAPPQADTARYDRLRADTGADDTVDASTEGASHEA